MAGISLTHLNGDNNAEEEQYSALIRDDARNLWKKPYANIAGSYTFRLALNPIMKERVVSVGANLFS
jgi:hypothetical protein